MKSIGWTIRVVIFTMVCTLRLVFVEESRSDADHVLALQIIDRVECHNGQLLSESTQLILSYIVVTSHYDDYHDGDPNPNAPAHQDHWSHVEVWATRTMTSTYMCLTPEQLEEMEKELDYDIIEEDNESSS